MVGKLVGHVAEPGRRRAENALVLEYILHDQAWFIKS
jgi:hypothetical protein